MKHVTETTNRGKIENFLIAFVLLIGLAGMLMAFQSNETPAVPGLMDMPVKETAQQWSAAPEYQTLR